MKMCHAINPATVSNSREGEIAEDRVEIVACLEIKVVPLSATISEFNFGRVYQFISDSLGTLNDIGGCPIRQREPASAVASRIAADNLAARLGRPGNEFLRCSWHGFLDKRAYYHVLRNAHARGTFSRHAWQSCRNHRCRVDPDRPRFRLVPDTSVSRPTARRHRHKPLADLLQPDHIRYRDWKV